MDTHLITCSSCALHAVPTGVCLVTITVIVTDVFYDKHAPFSPQFVTDYDTKRGTRLTLTRAESLCRPNNPLSLHPLTNTNNTQTNTYMKIYEPFPAPHKHSITQSTHPHLPATDKHPPLLSYSVHVSLLSGNRQVDQVAVVGRGKGYLAHCSFLTSAKHSPSQLY